MNARHTHRKRDDTLAGSCTAYAAALDRYETALAGDNFSAMARAWSDAQIAAEAFRQGIEYGRRGW